MKIPNETITNGTTDGARKAERRNVNGTGRRGNDGTRIASWNENNGTELRTVRVARRRRSGKDQESVNDQARGNEQGRRTGNGRGRRNETGRDIGRSATELETEEGIVREREKETRIAREGASVRQRGNEIVLRSERGNETDLPRGRENDLRNENEQGKGRGIGWVRRTRLRYHVLAQEKYLEKGWRT